MFWIIVEEVYIKVEYVVEKLVGFEKMDVVLNYVLEKLSGLGINRFKEEVWNKI